MLTIKNIVCFAKIKHAFYTELILISPISFCRAIVLSCYRAIVLSCYRAIVLSCFLAFLLSCFRGFLLSWFSEHTHIWISTLAPNSMNESTGDNKKLLNDLQIFQKRFISLINRFTSKKIKPTIH